MRVLALLTSLLLASPTSVGAERAPAQEPLRVPILVYHGIYPHKPGDAKSKQAFDVSPESFADQMRYLRDHDIPVVSLSALMDALEGKGSLPPRAVVLTFDDGWETQYVHAVPLLRQYGFTATFFVFTHAIGRNDRYFTWDQLRGMQQAGMTIGSHTITHPFMTRITDPKQMREETVGSREALEKHLGTPVQFFAYPFGVVSKAATAAVEAAGYRAARGFPGGVTNTLENRWVLHSMAVTDNMERFRQIVDPQKPLARRKAPAQPAASATPKVPRPL